MSRRKAQPGVRRGTALVTAIASGIMAAIVLAAAGCRPAPPASGTALRIASAPQPLPQPLPRPTPRPDDFVGSAACAACHEAISASFARSPMGLSLAAVGSEPVIETYPSAPVADRGREYVAERTDTGAVHHEIVRDTAGGVLCDLAEPVRFVLGSGELGRSYLVAHGGRLYQSPLGWYSGRDRWDLSPGYRGADGPRFERAIGDGCLACHAGRMEPSAAGPAVSARYGPAVFAEGAIGCERCHGPGGRHVAAMEGVAAGAPAGDPCIVNPAALDAPRREDVCNQCHLGGAALLPRFGRSLFDFRPGDRLEDTRVVLVREAASPGAADHRPVSHVEQMRASRCFRASDGRLGCTSCHDPHAAPPRADAGASHSARCATCHDAAACPLPVAERELPPAVGSCIHCHMPRQSADGVPHTALTDHTIRRRPGGTPDGPPAATVAAAFVPFDAAGDRLPAREVARARGLHLAGEALARRDPAAAEAAELFLVPGAARVGDPAAVVAALGDDVESLAAVAALAEAAGRTEVAAACHERVLAIDPEDEQALVFLAATLGRAGRLAGAIELADRLVAAHPAIAAHHRLRGRILAASGRPGDATAAARAAIDRDPSATDLRRWLAGGLRRAGRDGEAAAEERRADAIETATRGRGAGDRGAAQGSGPAAASSTVSD